MCGIAGVMANGIGVGGLPGILSIQPQYWGVYALAMLAAIVVPIALTLILYNRAEKKGTLDDVELIDEEVEAVVSSQ
ncbi:MAG: PTS system trehalose-specific IIC component [Psychromonas sp.]